MRAASPNSPKQVAVWEPSRCARQETASSPDYSRIRSILVTASVRRISLGRKNEIYDIFKHVGATANGELVARDVVIYGPRGSGKTALLRVVGEELEKLEVHATLELMAATDMQSAEDARRELIGVVGQPLWEALKPQEWGLDWRGVQAKWQRGELSRSEVRKGLVAKCKSKPLILLIDEAHLMSPAACGELLNEVLKIRGRGGPRDRRIGGQTKIGRIGKSV